MRSLLKSILNPLVILGAIGFGGILFGAVLALLYAFRPGPASSAPAPTAILNVIAAPTATLPVATTAPTQIPTPTSPVPPSPQPGEISLGQYVQISGTGGDGLRMRTDPGLKSQVIFIALEAEVFQVKDGPKEADGYTWWYLVAPVDPAHHGWAVSNYLQVVQNP